jgi:hypothetical protein
MLSVIAHISLMSACVLIATAAKEYTPSLDEGPAESNTTLLTYLPEHRKRHYTIQQLFLDEMHCTSIR